MTVIINGRARFYWHWQPNFQGRGHLMQLKNDNAWSLPPAKSLHCCWVYQSRLWIDACSHSLIALQHLSVMIPTWRYRDKKDNWRKLDIESRRFSPLRPIPQSCSIMQRAANAFHVIGPAQLYLKLTTMTYLAHASGT